MSPCASGGIQRQTSSFLISAATKPAIPQKKKKHWPPEDEIIPDSEEERIQEEKNRQGCVSTEPDSDVDMLSSPAKGPHSVNPTVIVISSDSEMEVAPPKSRTHKRPEADDPFLDGTSGNTGRATTGRKRDLAISEPALTQKGKSKARTPIPGVESEGDSDVVCISDTESEAQPSGPSASPVKQKIIQRTATPYAPILPPTELDVDSDDSAILTFDPHVRAKPVLRTPATKSKASTRAQGLPDPALTPAPIKPPASKSPKKRKVTSPEQLQREAYAQTLFDELNATVFNGGMPVETEVVWNVRLSSTAGRAFWSKHGQVTSKIELSPKVVDCDERVRHTLAHEMCHLAVWVLDGATNEQGHGSLFKAWASRVTKARPEITISTKHSYDINYKFQWECVQCGKVYGRHSNSINVEKSACGVCDPPGRLKPMFEKPQRRVGGGTSGSKLANGSPRESPRSMDRPLRSPTKSPTKSKTTLTKAVPRKHIASSDNTDEDDQVEELIRGLGGIGI